MVLQGIKDRSMIRKHMVTEKQGCREECETREARSKERSGDGCLWGEGEIQGRSKEDP